MMGNKKGQVFGQILTQAPVLITILLLMVIFYIGANVLSLKNEARDFSYFSGRIDSEVLADLYLEDTVFGENVLDYGLEGRITIRELLKQGMGKEEEAQRAIMAFALDRFNKIYSCNEKNSFKLAKFDKTSNRKLIVIDYPAIKEAILTEGDFSVEELDKFCFRHQDSARGVSRVVDENSIFVLCAHMEGRATC